MESQLFSHIPGLDEDWLIFGETISETEISVQWEQRDPLNQQEHK